MTRRQMPNLLTKNEMRRIIREAGISLRRTLGQNFLFDHNLLRAVADLAEIGPHDVILEVGAGLGNLTRLLAEKAFMVVAVEVDPALCELCAALNSSLSNVTLVNADILSSKHQLNPEPLKHLMKAMDASTSGALKMVSNLPYSIATPLLINILESDLPFSLLVVTVQKEMADRLCAKMGDREYGPISILTSVHADVENIRTLPPQVFWPEPKVESALLKLTPHSLPSTITDYLLFRNFVLDIFKFRRKTLANAILQMLRRRGKQVSHDEILNLPREAGVDGRLRPENIDVPTLSVLAGLLESI